MTITIDELVPEQLGQAIKPLLPAPSRRYGVPAPTTARRWLASSTSCAPGCPGGCCPPASLAAGARSPAGGGCATGSAPACGSSSTTCCSTNSAARASSTGRGRVSTRSACAPSGGRANRPEPDRPRQARDQVPPAGRPQRHPAGRRPVGRQHPRLAAAGGRRRRRPAGQGATRGGRVGRASAPPSCTWTRATTTRAAGGHCADAGSPRGSPGVAWSPASGWAATGMWSSGRWRGWWAIGGCRSATSGAPTSCWGSCAWLRAHLPQVLEPGTGMNHTVFLA
jgi:hypothetical protein